MQRRNPRRPAGSLDRDADPGPAEDWFGAKGRHRRAHPGCPQTVPEGPNDVWGADYKGQFRLKNGQYCFPLTVSDLATRYLLGCDAHPEVSLEKTKQYFEWLFATYGLPRRIRTDNGVPFASNALARLSQLSVWFIKLGIYPELIEPGEPQQNGVHERMHRTLKQDTTFPPAAACGPSSASLMGFGRSSTRRRPHEALGMKRPAEVYQPSERLLPRRIGTYAYPETLPGAAGEPLRHDPGAAQASVCQPDPERGLCRPGGGR